MKKKSLTIMEVFIVVLVIGVLATVAVPQFSKAKQRASNQEAKAMLKLLFDAEKMYYLDQYVYLACSDSSDCRNKFKVDIVSSSDWDYTINTVAAGTFIIQAQNILDSRTWTLNQNGGDPICNDAGHSLNFCFD